MTFCKNITVIFFLVITGCRPVEKKNRTLQGYDMAKPVKFFLPESLQEISGISFHNQNSDTVYAVQDEEGKLFRMAWNVKKQYHTKFANRGDYEDLAITREKVIILKSNGSLFSFPFAEAIYDVPEGVREWKNLLPKGEYEGMYGDETTGKIYILCKNCVQDNGKETESGYILQSGDSIYRTGSFDINIHTVISISDKYKRGLRASAMAKNTVNNNWYILSAVNKLIVVTDSSWNVIEICLLNPDSFNQPEGIAFDSLGNLYISNEGDDFSVGRILKFDRKL